METLLVATGHCLHPLIIVALNGQIMICSFVNKLVRSFTHIYNLWMLACVILSFSFFFFLLLGYILPSKRMQWAASWPVVVVVVAPTELCRQQSPWSPQSCWRTPWWSSCRHFHSCTTEVVAASARFVKPLP